MTLERYIVAHDCGVVLNPMLLDGQVHGGVAQGIGNALTEELHYDLEGQLLTSSYLDYLLPGAAEVPMMETLHLETPSSKNPEGIKGAGEGGTIPVPAVVSNAVDDALDITWRVRYAHANHARPIEDLDPRSGAKGRLQGHRQLLVFPTPNPSSYPKLFKDPRIRCAVPG